MNFKSLPFPGLGKIAGNDYAVIPSASSPAGEKGMTLLHPN
ncbi:hypothetical protein [Gibbsiella quercinecans]|nr:hypothetical protein [Gibbsiella quercinecans]